MTVEKDRVETLQGKLDNTMVEKATQEQERKKGWDTLSPIFTLTRYCYYSRTSTSIRGKPCVTKIYNSVYVSMYFLNSKFEPIKIKITGFITVPVQVVLCMVQK